jgi:hypothetical protein
MLDLGQGARYVGLDETRGIYVYPDYSDPLQWYYVPAAPHVSDGPDGPAVRLLLVREDAAASPPAEDDVTGLFMLDVDTSWPADDLRQAAGRLQVEAELSDLPRLNPLPIRSGSVRFLLLDSITPEADADPDKPPPPTQFVTRTLQVAHPSLYGDNRAIFQAEVTRKGAAALMGSLDGMLPIGVVYELTFAGLQPAYRVKAKVDWDRVVDHFSEQYKFSFLFFDNEISKSLDKLVDDRVIDIDVEVQGIGEEAMDGDREAVLTAVRELIFETFFQQTFSPTDAAGNSTGDKAAGIAGGIARGILFAGAGIGYHRKEVHIEELRQLDLDWKVRRAALRTIYPQAHIWSMLGQGGTKRDDLVTLIDLADFHRAEVLEVVANAAWDADGVAGVNVEVEYTDADSGEVRSWHTRLDKATPRTQLREFADRASGGRYRYRYEVVFSPTEVPGPAAVLSSGEAWEELEGFVLTIDPRLLFSPKHVQVTTMKGFPFDRWPGVQVFLRHRTDDGAWELTRDALLDGTASLDARFRTVPAGGTNELRLRLVGADGRVWEQPWFPLETEQHLIVDPEPRTLVVTAVVSGDRSKILNLLVDLEYEDLDAGVFREGHLSFAPDTINVPQRWTISIADPTRRRYRYRMTLVTQSGDFVQSGWIGTDAPSIPVGEVYVRTLAVEVVAGAVDPKVDTIEVALAYHDADNDVHAEQRSILGSNGRAEWKVLLKDAAKRAWQYTVTWRLESGFEVTVGPTSSTDSFLAIPGHPPGDR